MNVNDIRYVVGFFRNAIIAERGKDMTLEDAAWLHDLHDRVIREIRWAEEAKEKNPPPAYDTIPLNSINLPIRTLELVVDNTGRAA